jgi:regulator of sirC expression with transglutaminase-like and TPR domain
MKEEIQTLAQEFNRLRSNPAHGAIAAGIGVSGMFDEPDAELRSLFSLLDDPDERIAEAVTDRIRSRGIGALAPLAAFLERTSDPLALSRAKRISLEFNTDVLASEFETLSLDLAEGKRTAFEDGVYLIARYGNPSLDVEHVRSEIDEFAQLLNYRIANLSSALEVLDEVNHFFFEDLRFRGNQAKFMEPENSFIDIVVERRTGIPISLAAVYLLVVRSRLGLPFSGASAPGHFLVRYDGLHSEPLFIDAFNGGVLLRERDIKHYLDSSGLPFNRQFLEPAPPRAILLRMIRNLIIVFNEHGNMPGRTAFERFMRILAPNAEEGQAFLRGLEG